MIRRTAEERQLALALAAASDGALARVVAMVDSMPLRDQADRLLDPVRPRLRELRPARPLRVERLLFQPLDGVIVPAAEWQRGGFRLPRSALPALAAQLREAMPEAVEAIVADAVGLSFDDAEATARLGNRLWALAARLSPGPPPPGWKGTTGLPPEDHAPMLALCLGVWRHAAMLWDLSVAAGAGPPPEAMVRAALAGPAAEGEAVFNACLTTLLRQAVAPGSLADIAAGLGPMPHLVAERTLSGFVEAAVPVLDAAEPAAAALQADRFAEILDDLERVPLCRGGAWRARLQRLRNEAAKAARTAFTGALDALVVAPVARLVAAASDAEVEGLEEVARAVKDLELSGRRLGEVRGFDEALRSLIPTLLSRHGAGTPDGLTRMDIARLIEILCGCEAAREVLAG